MEGTMLYGPRDVRFEERPDPTIVEPTDAILRISAACVCGSDLWPYRGIAEVNQPQPMGHEYCGIVEEVGSEVRHIKPGQFVVGSFWASDNTCPICQAGYQSRCVDARPMGAEARKRSCCASRWQTVRWSRRQSSRRMSSSRACSRPPMCSVPAGSARPRRKQVPARRLQLLGMAQ